MKRQHRRRKGRAREKGRREERGNEGRDMTITQGCHGQCCQMLKQQPGCGWLWTPQECDFHLHGLGPLEESKQKDDAV